MSRRRVLATAVLAAGALASIATSQATWDISDRQPPPDTTLDAVGPVVGYQVRAELRGPTEYTDGWLEIDLHGLVPQVGEGPASATATVTVTRDADPEDIVTGPLHAGSDAIEFHGSAALWRDCQTPCVETFTVWIDRGEVIEPARALIIAGTIAAHIEGVGENAPPSVEVDVEITPIEAAP